MHRPEQLWLGCRASPFNRRACDERTRTRLGRGTTNRAWVHITDPDRICVARSAFHSESRRRSCSPAESLLYVSWRARAGRQRLQIVDLWSTHWHTVPMSCDAVLQTTLCACPETTRHAGAAFKGRGTGRAVNNHRFWTCNCPTRLGSTPRHVQARNFSSRASSKPSRWFSPGGIDHARLELEPSRRLGSASNMSTHAPSSVTPSSWCNSPAPAPAPAARHVAALCLGL